MYPSESKAWNLINRVETNAQEIPKLYTEINEIENKLVTFDNTNDKEFKELMKVAKSKMERASYTRENIQREATIFIKENQFWFTDKEYNLLLDFIKINQQYIDGIIQKQPPHEIAELEDMVREKRVNIVSARNLIFEE